MKNGLGKKSKADRIIQAIEIYNTNRGLLRDLYKLRKGKPPVTGAEMMEVTLAGLFMDKREHNDLIREILPELDNRTVENAEGIRLMVLGSEQDDVDLIKIIESLGAVVVTDDLCTGSRNIWTDVDTGKDPVEAIANRMIERPPCSAKDVPGRRRIDHVIGLARDFNVDGVIILQQKFCDPQQWDNPTLMAALDKNNIPGMKLETDLNTLPGPFRTRVEAFLETLDSRTSSSA